MGLDMYLSKKMYVKRWEHEKPENQYSVLVKRGGKKVTGIKPERISYIIEEVAYWRKANAIHNWFVQNVQSGEDDCGEYYVSTQNLKDLLDTCDTVIKASKLVAGKIRNGYSFDTKNGRVDNIEDGFIIENPAIAEKLLPAQEGFFFGSTDYNEWYLKDIKYTKDVIQKLLDEGEAETGMIYYSSSW
jgi:hypothetical protein